MGESDQNIRAFAPEWKPYKGYKNPLSVKQCFPSSSFDYECQPRFSSASNIRYKGCSSVHQAPLVGRGMYTHVPEDVQFHGLKLGPWGSEFGPKAERDSWVSRDIIGSYVLIRVKRRRTKFNNKLLPLYLISSNNNQVFFNFNYVGRGNKSSSPIHLEFYPEKSQNNSDHIIEHTSSRYEWIFGYIQSYNSYSGLHELVFNFDNVFFDGYWVDLEKCLVQIWTPPDVRQKLASLINNTQHSNNKYHLSAVIIQKRWKCWYLKRSHITRNNRKEKTKKNQNRYYRRHRSRGNLPQIYRVLQPGMPLPTRNPRTHPKDTNYTLSCSEKWLIYYTIGYESDYLSPIGSCYDKQLFKRHSRKERHYNTRWKKMMEELESTLNIDKLKANDAHYNALLRLITYYNESFKRGWMKVRQTGPNRFTNRKYSNDKRRVQRRSLRSYTKNNLDY